MKDLNFNISYPDGIITFENEKTTLGFIRYNEKVEDEHIFVNSMFRKRGLVTPLINFVEKKNGFKPKSQRPKSPLASKLFRARVKK